MTLAFSTQLNKVPTFFVEKILTGLYNNNLISFERFYELKCNYYSNCTNGDYKNLDVIFKPKIHTIRVDEKQRWKAGMIIHYVINNRTKNRYQFAPLFPCTSTQKISITYWYNKKTQLFDLPMVVIDDKELSKKEIETLAVNDGFENSVEFFKYFNTNFTGVLNHWTNTKY
jgi:hypothetical protein